MISIIVAASENNVIGVNGTLPWHLPRDLKYFKSITTNHSIVMGRNTYESIGKPLPNRNNIIVTTNPNYVANGCVTAHDIKQVLSLAESEEIFIIGGAQLYQAFLPYCDKIYLTRVHTEIEGDTFLPNIDFSNWELQSEIFHEADDKNAYNMSFRTYIKSN